LRPDCKVCPRVRLKSRLMRASGALCDGTNALPKGFLYR